MEMDRLPCRSWVVSHKIVAVARWTRREKHPPKRHPPQVRQLHPAGHAPRRRRSQRARAGAGLQPLPRMQTVCHQPAQWAPSARRAISTSTRASPTTSGNSRAASQTGCRPWRIARTRPVPRPGHRFRKRVDVAEPPVQTQDKVRRSTSPKAHRLPNAHRLRNMQNADSRTSRSKQSTAASQKRGDRGVIKPFKW
jgi:hypothetical protein